MSITAFGARRVTESLRSIERYLDQGVTHARRVDPGGTTTFSVETPVVDDGPRLTQVQWIKKGSKSAAAIPFADLTPHHPIEVEGQFLDDIVTFRLIRAADATCVLPATLGKWAHDGGLAIVNTTDATPGEYHAQVIDRAGQSFLLPRACEIVGSGPRAADAIVTVLDYPPAAAAGPPAGASPAPGAPAAPAAPAPAPAPSPLQLGGMFPNMWAAGSKQDVAVLVLQGTPKRFRIVDPSGQYTSPTCQIVEQPPQWSDQLKQWSRGALLVPVSITVPPMALLGIRPPDGYVLHLVGEDESQSTDTLTFIVRQSPEAAGK